MESPPLPPPSRPGRRWALLSLGLLLGVVLLALGYRWWRQQQVIAKDLRAIAGLELQAWSQGDEDLFISLQSDEGDWPIVQERVFQINAVRQPGALAPAVPYTYTGQVLKAWGDGQSGWVVVEVSMADQPHQALWYYRNTPQGWRHAAFDDDALGGRREKVVDSIRLLYRELDAQPVSHMVANLQSWLDTLMPAFGIEATSPLTIELRYDPPMGYSSYAWLGDDRSHLTIVSPALFPLQADGRPAEVYRQALAWHVAGWLVNQAAGVTSPEDLAPEVQGLWADVVAWGMGQLGLTMPATPRAARPGSRQQAREPPQGEARTGDAPARGSAGRIVGKTGERAGASGETASGRVALQYGPEALARLVHGLGQVETIHQAFALAGLPPPAPTAYFRLLLQAQHQTLLMGSRKAYTALFDFRADPAWSKAHLVEGFNTFSSLYPSVDPTGLIAYFNSAAPGPVPELVSVLVPRVVVVYVLGSRRERAWVEIEPLVASSDSVGSTGPRTIFFRREGERWLYTSPDLAYLGDLREEQALYVILRYYQADAEHVAGLAPRLSESLLRAADDFRLSARALMTVTVEITPSWTPGSSDEATLRHPSPSVEGVQPGWYLAWELVSKVGLWRLNELTEGKDRSWQGDGPARFMLYNAIIIWEVEQLDWERPSWVEPYLAPPPRDSLSLQPLSEVWREDGLSTEDQAFATFAVANTLVHFLVETRGPELMSAMLEALWTAESLDTWLQAVSGQTVAEIEDDWRAWVLERLAEAEP